MLGWQLLRLTPVADWWLFELLDIFGVAMFAAIPLLALVSMLCASRAGGLWLLVPLLVLGWEYGSLALPRRTPTEGRPVRVMTTNLLAPNGDLARVAAAIVVESPDVVAIQELSRPMSAYLARQLRAEYPHQLLGPTDSVDGLGILSRHPIHVEPATGWYQHVCSCQRVTLDVDGRTVTLVNVHPPTPRIEAARLGPLRYPTGFDPSRTSGPLDAALAGIDRRGGPLLIVGDFNTGDRQPKYRELMRDLSDAHREAGWGLGLSFPVREFEGWPGTTLIRIDYVLHDRSIATRAAFTGWMPGSDHRYVVADLLLP
ncbi:MAG: endonuclease/exonuclease/phosphatase family protein [Chloroflexi bacterium]|nr:endonuclease/exonuclease/phosphatase family protein [Chloroflexota bacterium]